MFFCQKKEQRLKILLTFFIFTGLLFYISLNAKVKARVFYPAFFAVMFSLIYFNKNRETGLVNLAVFIVILSVSHHNLYISYRRERSNKLLKNKFNEQSKLINGYLKGNKKLIPFGASYSIEHGDPFSISSTFTSQKILFSGWLTNTPLNKGKFDSFTYYINNYGLLIGSGASEWGSLLISSSILKQNNIKVTPKILSNEQGTSIIEFQTNSAKTHNE